MYGGHRLGDNLYRRASSRRSRDRQTRLALPDGASRLMGLRPARGADPRGHHGRRPTDQSARADHQTVVRVRARSHDGQARVADRRARRAAVDRARRAHGADATDPDEAAAVRSARRDRREPDRLHAAVASRGGRDLETLHARAAVHAAVDTRRPPGRQSRHDRVAGLRRRTELDRRRRRSRHRHSLCALRDRTVRCGHRARRPERHEPALRQRHAAVGPGRARAACRCSSRRTAASRRST